MGRLQFAQRKQLSSPIMKSKYLSQICSLVFALLCAQLWLAPRAEARPPTDYGHAILFNGVNQYVVVSNAGLVLPTNEVTVEFWVYATAYAQQSAFMMQPDDAGNRFNGHIDYNNGDTFWDFGDIGNGGRLNGPNPSNSVGAWVHYALVASQVSNYMTIYTNGNVFLTQSGMTPIVPEASDLHIGGDSDYYFNGAIDEFRVWSVARTQAQIQSDYGETLTGNEANLFLYYKFDSTSGNVATNSAVATGAAYNGILVNGPSWVLGSLNNLVSNTNDDGSPGSLRQAVATATFGTTVDFDPSLSGQTILLTNGPIILSNRCTIDASTLPGGIQINGNSNSPVFVVSNSATVTLASLIITNGFGNGSGQGGGIANYGTLTLTNCVITGNVCTNSADGGGILNSGLVRAINCVFTGNTVFGGSGGGAIYNSATMMLTNCIISGNTAAGGIDGGGAIDCYGPLIMSQCIVTGNLATNTEEGGGGLCNEGAAITLSQCTFSSNVTFAGYGGGGIYTVGATFPLIIDRCTLSANSAFESTYGGGGICDRGAIALTNSTIAENSDTAGIGGGGIYTGGLLTANNCTIAGNSAAGVVGGGLDINSGTANLTNTIVAGNTALTATDIAGNITGVNNLTNGDPMLEPLGNYGGPTQTMPPLPGSPALDAGLDSVTSLYTIDQRGFPRLSGTDVDIGAVEFLSPVVSTTADSGIGSLRTAVAYISSNTPVTFAPSLSGQSILLTSGPITLAQNITINGSSLSNGIRLDGNGDFCVIVVNHGVTAVLNSVTITNGADFSGNLCGGIWNQGTLTVSNCTIAGNYGTNGYGGGIYNDGILMLSNCLLLANAGAEGGGLANDEDGTATVADCMFSSNISTNGNGGGGIYNEGTMTVSDDVFTGNSSSGWGGGAMCNSEGTLTLYRSILVSNIANNANGGAVLNHDTLNMSNTTISGNMLIGNNGSGGGVHNDATMSIDNCTIVSNSAPLAIGGGIVNYDSLTLNNCTITGNSATNGGGIDNLQGTLNLTNSIVTGNTATTSNDIGGSFVGMNNLTNGNPMLAGLGNYGGPTETMPPLPGSPAIDAGVNSVTNTLATDQRGLARLSGSFVDIGAVELQQASAVTLAASNITETNATLNAVVTPNELQTMWYFQYGANTNYGNTTASNSLPAGPNAIGVSNTISGLVPGVTYHYQIVVVDSISTKTGADAVFTTTPLLIVDNQLNVTLTAPADKSVTASSNIVVSGTLKESGSVTAGVQITVNSNSSASATLEAVGHGSAHWTYTAALVPGANVITAQATGLNNSQIVSPPVRHTVFYVTNALSAKNTSHLTLAVSPANAGKISGAKTGAALELYKVYTATAAPAANWIFTNWTLGANLNSVLSTNPTLAFIMESNLVLQANFVTNPFAAVIGTYNGLFSPVTGVTEESSGYLSATLATTARGAYSAKLMLDGGAYSFNGAFDLSGDAEATVARSSAAPIEVFLHLNVVTPDNVMTGYIVNFASNGWTSALVANRAVFNAKSNPAAKYAAKYTLVIPPGDGAPASEPGGYSYATLSGTTAGAATISGSLADKSAVSQSTTISSNGAVPLYVSLYAKKGSLQGWLTLTNATNINASPVQMVTGSSLAWIKPAMGKSLYPAGYTNTGLTAAGSIYTNGFALANGTLTVSNGNLLSALVISNVSVANNKITSTSGDVTGTVASTGIASLTIKTSAKAKISAKGVVLETISGTNAAGWFLGTNQSGYFLLH
jgi:hypothetical protein